MELPRHVRPRPTLTFHLGLFPIVILLWLWADSMRNKTTWYRSRHPEQVLMIGIAGSNFAFGTIDLRPEAEHRRILTQTPGYGRIERYRRPSFQGPLFPSLTGPDLSFEVYPDLTLNIRRIPFWLLLACYLPAWLALSYWRSRSKLRRIAASLPESGAAADRFEN